MHARTCWKCLAFVKQLLFKQQFALQRLIEGFSVKAQQVGVDLKAADFQEV